MEQFDPYRMWLGIPANEQPPNLYRLLGIAMFESNPGVIAQAADRQAAIVASFQAGPYWEAARFILNELAGARAFLLDPQRKAEYDRDLGQSLSFRGERQVASPPPPAMHPAPPGAYGAPLPLQPGQYPPAAPGFQAPGFQAQGFQAPGFPGNAGRESPMPAFNLPPGGPMSGQQPCMPMAPQYPAVATGAVAGMMPMAAPIGGLPAQVPGMNAPAPVPIGSPGTAAPGGNGAATAPDPMAGHDSPPVAPTAAPPFAPSPSSRVGYKYRRPKQQGVSKETLTICGVVLGGCLLLGVWLIAANSGSTSSGWKRLAGPEDEKSRSVGGDKTKKVASSEKGKKPGSRREPGKTGRDLVRAKPAQAAVRTGVPAPSEAAIAQPTTHTPPQPGTAVPQTGKNIGPDPYIDGAIGPPAETDGPDAHGALQVPRHGLDQPGGNPPAPVNPPAQVDPPPAANPPPKVENPPAHPHDDIGPPDDSIGLPPVEK
jgi:hypothetical protein